MAFTILHRIFAKPIFLPSQRAACRLYHSKDLKDYSNFYYTAPHQLLGANWSSTFQSVAIDVFLLKHLWKIFILVCLISWLLLICL